MLGLDADPDRQGVDIDALPHAKAWHENIAARPAVKRAVALFANDRKEFSQMSEEKGRSVKVSLGPSSPVNKARNDNLTQETDESVEAFLAQWILKAAWQIAVL